VPPAAGHPGHRHRRGHRSDLPLDGHTTSADWGSPRPSPSSTSSSCPACLPGDRLEPPDSRRRDAPDAARSLGAGWPRTIVQVVVPNIRGGILSASVLAVAPVLGRVHHLVAASRSTRSRS
jgi:hypothetical protein